MISRILILLNSRIRRLTKSRGHARLEINHAVSKMGICARLNNTSQQLSGGEFTAFKMIILLNCLVKRYDARDIAGEVEQHVHHGYI